jgi:hypothetical protein
MDASTFAVPPLEDPEELGTGAPSSAVSAVAQPVSDIKESAATIRVAVRSKP